MSHQAFHLCVAYQFTLQESSSVVVQSRLPSLGPPPLGVHGFLRGPRPPKDVNNWPSDLGFAQSRLSLYRGRFEHIFNFLSPLILSNLRRPHPTSP